MLDYDVINENEELKLKLIRNNLDEYLIIYWNEEKNFKNEVYEKYKYWEYHSTIAKVETEEEIKILSSEIIKILKVNDRNLLDVKMTNNLFKIIESIKKNNKLLSLHNIIKECEMIFEKQKRVLEEKKLIGYLGEFVFLEKAMEISNSAEYWFHHNDLMEYDFYIKEKNAYLEVKTNSSYKEEFLVKFDQIKNQNPYIIGVTFKQDDNGVNLIYFLDKFRHSKNDFLKDKIEELESIVDKFPKVLDYKINLKDVHIDVFEKTDLPLLKVENLDSRIFDITYKFKADKVKKYSLEEFIKVIV